MRNYTLVLLLITLLFINFSVLSQDKSIVKPVDYFGFEPGSDRELFTYEELVNYLSLLDNSSDKLKMIKIGTSPMGKPMYACFISSVANINNLDELKKINRELALNYLLTDAERKDFIGKGKTFVYATLSMHSTEVGPSQAAPLIAYDLSTTTDEKKLEWLDNTVFMVVPCHNPDGMDMVVEHYKKYKGTRNEGCSMPGVYHKYVGHDNNRDFVTLTQSDTRAIASVYNLDWFPQVMVEKHQMGSTGVRYFVPPGHDPIAENIDAGIWNWLAVFGSNMITDMTAENLKGIAQHYLFDDYWPGSTTTSTWKNTIGMLTEAAGAKIATPLYIEPTELRVGGKGLSEYKKSVNMPELWEGGDWKLSDIIKYEISSTYSILKTSSIYREEILTFRNDLCKKEVAKGLSEPPYHYILPLIQNDQSELLNLVNLLKEHGVRVNRLSADVFLNDKKYYTGDFVISLSQPFRSFIKEVMESQKFPLRHYTPNGEIIKPYDITSWSLPLHRGLESFEINEYFNILDQSVVEADLPYFNFEKGNKAFYGIIFPAGNNESYKVAFKLLAAGIEVYRLTNSTLYNGKKIKAGSFYIKENVLPEVISADVSVPPVYLTSEAKMEMIKLKKPVVGLVETWFHDMDAGWTRFVFDSYNINYTVIRPDEFEKANLSKQFDVIVFPSSSKDILMEGKYKSGSDYNVSSYPAEYAKGMGANGMKNLMSFLDNGGIILSWGESTDLFDQNLSIERSKDLKEDFRLPFRNVAGNLKASGLYCPGSFVKINLKEDNPLTYGLQDDIGVFFRGNQIFSTSIPNFDMDRRVIGSFPEENILLSGYCSGQENLSNKTAMVWFRKGKGQLVLMGFNPQFRASTQGSFKLLFNSLLLEKMK